MTPTQSLSDHLACCQRCSACRQMAEYYKAQYMASGRAYDAMAEATSLTEGQLLLQCEDHRYWRKAWRGAAYGLILVVVAILEWAWMRHGRIW